MTKLTVGCAGRRSWTRRADSVAIDDGFGTKKKTALEGVSGPPYTHSVVNLERGRVAKHGKDPLPSIQDPDCAKNMHTSRGANSSWPSCMPIGVWPAVHMVFKTKLTSFPTSWLSPGCFPKGGSI